MAQASVPVKEGYIDINIPNLPKPCQTWYRVHGELGKGGQRPLVVLHGGPGVAHNYLDSVKDLASHPYSRPVIHYDQVGCGKSTHLPELKGEAGQKFWTVELFLAELENLTKALGIQDSYDVLGNSWGGMLGMEHAATQPKGLHKLVVADSPSSMVQWVKTANRLREGLPKDVQETLTRCEKEGKTDSKEYEEAVKVFYRKHVITIEPWPEAVNESFTQLEADPTVYHTMNGPSEFYVVGTLKSWDISERLLKIKVPVLLINGRYDEAQDEVVQPLFDGIEHAKWVQFSDSAHMPHFEERERYMQVVDSFLSH
jgi:proline-specific peptidase